MAYSGTISRTVFNTGKVIDSAVRRCKIPAEQITPEHVEIANNELYLFLSSLVNQVAPLWCTTKTLYPLYDGGANIEAVLGTVDVLEATLRSLNIVTGTNVVSASDVKITFTEATMVSTVGIVWLNVPEDLVFQRSDDGVTWTNVGIGYAPYGAQIGDKAWFDIDEPVAALKFRIIATIGAAALTLGNTPSELPLARLNRSDYINMPNKAFGSARPLQFWLDRQARVPIIRLWPMPNSDAVNQQLVVWSQRHIMDVGSLVQEIEVPQRWYDAVVAGLAARLAQEIPEVDAGMIPILDQKAQQTLYIAQQEERDKSPQRLAPNFSAYTA